MAIRVYWGIRDEISAQDGVLYRSQRIIIPRALRSDMLRQIHYNHVGGEACYRQARNTILARYAVRDQRLCAAVLCAMNMHMSSKKSL